MPGKMARSAPRPPFGLEHISAESNWGIPKAFWMGDSVRINSFMEANDAEALFPGSARAPDRSRRMWRVAA